MPLRIRTYDPDTLDALDRLMQSRSTQKHEHYYHDKIMGVLEQMALAPDELYREYDIPKGNGKSRRIEAPNDDLKELQGRIQRVIRHAKLPNCVHGFRPSVSAYSGLRVMLDQLAKQDLNLGAVYQTDIQDFFPSVKEADVRSEVRRFLYRMLHKNVKGPQLPLETINELADLITTLCCVHGRLPQGAPTSPSLANMVGANFDRKIMKRMPDSQVYGRYADDIVVIGAEQISDETREMIQAVLNKAGFRISFPKTLNEEGRYKYKIWGVDVFPGDENQGVGMRFKLPAQVEREWSEYIFKAMEKYGPSLPESVDEESGKTVLDIIIGRLSHASIVTWYGGCKRDEIYCLPPRLAHAWNIFLREYVTFLKKRTPKWFVNSESDSGYMIKPAVVNKKVFTPADKEVLQKRTENIYSKAGLDLPEYRALIDEKKKHFLELYEQCKAEGLEIDIEASTEFETDVKAYVETLEEKKSQAECDQKISQAMAGLIAYVELQFDGQLPRENIAEGSLLTEDAQVIWDDDFWPGFLKQMETVSSEFKGLKWLFKDRELTGIQPEVVTNRVKIPGKRKKKRRPYLFLSGFRAPKKKKK